MLFDYFVILKKSKRQKLKQTFIIYFNNNSMF